jgi:cytochrome c peroxidase
MKMLIVAAHAVASTACGPMAGASADADPAQEEANLKGRYGGAARPSQPGYPGRPEKPGADDPSGDIVMSNNSAGVAATLSLTTPLKEARRNPFFQSLGTNGRTCESCHVLSANWGLAPEEVQARFDATDGEDPVFRLVDGANSPRADVSTVEARRRAYSMLLSKAVIRIGLPVPADGEIELVEVDDPYGFASAKEVSMFRRPLPSTNVAFLTATMWDGRESTPIADPLRGPNNTREDLAHQANDATLGHAEATTGMPPEAQKQVVDFELGLFSAQVSDNAAGSLTDDGAQGGPAALSKLGFYFGQNDVVAGDSRTGAPFDPNVFTLYGGWDHGYGANKRQRNARASVQRGEALFNRKTFTIAGVRGVNDVLGVPALQGTCTTCHDSPNLGHHSTRLPLDLGLTTAERRSPDMPLYTFCKRRQGDNGEPIPGTCDKHVERIQTTDPGRALVTGKWADMNLFKGPILRGLAPRGPYFHDGQAETLDDVVEFYNGRFNIGLTAQERADIAAFLRTL